MTIDDLYEDNVAIEGPKGRVTSEFNVSRTPSGTMWNTGDFRPYRHLTNQEGVQKEDVVGALATVYRNRTGSFTSPNEIHQKNPTLVARIYDAITKLKQ